MEFFLIPILPEKPQKSAGFAEILPLANKIKVMYNRSIMIIFDELKKHHIHFNPQQEQAVLDESSRLLLLAVPGSGKTTVMVSRIARLIGEKRVPPSAILTMTFSREAARDMEARFRTLFPSLPCPRFSTIHSFCYQVLARFAKAQGKTLPKNIETENAPIRKSQLLRRIYNSLNPDFIGDDALETLESEISYITNRMIPPEEFPSHFFETAKIGEIYDQYTAFKRENGLMDFDDMLTLTLVLFERNPALLRQYQQRYRYLNLDEAQDTSLLQHRIVERLAEKCDGLFMVGDEDQSIYSFRGACPQVLLNFGSTYPGAGILKMEQNFRSGREIVDRTNQFIRQNQNRYDKNMFCDKPGEDCIYEIELPDYSGQYEQILELIRTLPPGERLAVLYRNSESAVPLVDLLDQNGIPFYMKEHRSPFFKSFVARDIQSFFRLSRNPNDIGAFRNIYYKLYLSKKIYEYVESCYIQYDSVFDAVLSIRMLRGTDVRRITDIRDRLPQIWDMPPIRALHYIEDRLGYGSFLESRTGSTTENLHHKLNILKTVAAGCSSAEAFLSRLEELERRIAENPADRTAAVTLSTMHASKGLEFDRVAVLDLIEGLFPSTASVEARDGGDPASYEEEVRLFYVAATRAKKRLYLFESGKSNGRRVYPSGFLYHLLGEAYNPDFKLAGRKLYHTTYQKGVILALDGDTVTAEFELFGKRSFSLSYCTEHNIIKF